MYCVMYFVSLFYQNIITLVEFFCFQSTFVCILYLCHLSCKFCVFFFLSLIVNKIVNSRNLLGERKLCHDCNLGHRTILMMI